MPEPTTPPTPEFEGLTPEAIGKLIDEKVAAGVAEAVKARAGADTSSAPPAAPSPPAAGGAQPEGLAAMVEAALARAFKERDDEDALGMLEREIAELKAAVAAAPGDAVKQGARWARILVGIR